MRAQWLSAPVVLLLILGVGGCNRSSDGGSATPGDPARGDTTPGDPAAGDATAGDASAGDATGGDALAGDAAGGDALAGDAAGGDALAGDAAGGDALAGDAAGGDALAGDAGPGCTAITASELIASGPAGFYGTSTITPQLGGADADRLRLDFYDDTTGSFDLAGNGNDNFATCTQCLTVIEDEGTTSRFYFVASGQLDVDGATPPLQGSVSATLTGVNLVEVTIDSTTFVSVPVPGGGCLSINGPLTLATP